MAEMVMVACKAPNGLVLDLDRYETSGQNAVVRIVSGGPRVTLKGWAHPWGTPPGTEGGYALTAVPKDFWDRWMDMHKGCSLLADKIILPPHKDAIHQAHDHDAVPMMFAPAKEGDVRGVTKDKAA